jgi:hypothetical protein
MLSEKGFVEKLSQWDSEMLTSQHLINAYCRLSSDESKRYILVVLDNLNPKIDVYQLSETQVKEKLTELIDNYRNNSASYMPRVYILGLYTGEEFKDPTQWGRFLRN